MGTGTSPELAQNSQSAQKPLRMTDDRFRLAFEHAPIGMAIVDFDLRIRRVNRSLCEALGYDANELVDRSIIDLSHPDDIEPGKTLATKLMRGEIPFYNIEKRFITKTGTLAWLDITAVVITNEAGERVCGLAMVENITDRKRGQEALRTSEERYRSFVVNSSEGIWRLEVEEPIDTNLPAEEQISLLYKHGYLAECNDALARMHGHQRADDLVGSRFGEFPLASHPANTGALKKLISSGYRVLDLHTEDIDANGRRKYYSSSLIGIVILDRLMRIWGVQRDQTEQRTAELALEHSHHQLRALSGYLQTLREKERTDLAREMHDTLGQLLTGIKIDISLLRKNLRTTDPINLPYLTERLTEIDDAVGNTLATVKTLSTELRPGVLDKFGLVAAIEWQSEEFSQRFGIKCDCKVPKAEVNIPSDVSTALFRILQEALINVARHANASRVRVTLSVDKSEALLSITDNGRGITPLEINDPNSLGLLGMSERAEVLAGHLNVESKPDEGTTVAVRIPIKTNGVNVRAQHG